MFVYSKDRAQKKMITTHNNNINNNNNNHEEGDKDEHEHDMVMPGFRFHPTEEELIEFYLRRKVEGKPFNVELITFLDLYRFDPWELPAMAAIGEREWYFYVPRDRKYRNGDRPNRVTTSGYWKATGADRMIKSDHNSSRSIGLKKTLVFYSGKAPKGIRTSWIMNEYRLPHLDTERYQKAEISLCRVYKRAGVEDHPSVPRSVAYAMRDRPSSSRGAPTLTRRQFQQQAATAVYASEPPDKIEKIKETTIIDGRPSSGRHHVTTTLVLSNPTNDRAYNNIAMATPSIGAAALTQVDHEEDRIMLQVSSFGNPNNFTTTSFFAGQSSINNLHPNRDEEDDLHRLVNYQQRHAQAQAQAQANALPLLVAPATLDIPVSTAIADRLWDWNQIHEVASKDHFNSTPFK